MYASKLPHTQIDKFHHIARLGVYALLTLSVIAMTVSLNRPGTSVGSSGARAQSNSIFTCKSFKIVTSNNGAGEANATIGSDYDHGKLIYIVEIETNNVFYTTDFSIDDLGNPTSRRYPTEKTVIYTFDLSPYTPRENIKGTQLQFSSSKMHLGRDNVIGSCNASLTIGAGPTPTPPPVTSTATPTPTSTPPPATTSGSCSLSLNTASPKLNDNLTITITGTDIKNKNPKLFVYHGWDSSRGGALYQNFITTGLGCGSADSCTFTFQLKSELDKMSAAHVVDWSINGVFDGAPANMSGCSANFKVHDSVVLESYSISTEGAVSGDNTQNITIPYKHNKALKIAAKIRNPQLTNGQAIAAVDVYDGVWSGSGSQPALKRGGIQAVGDSDGNFIFTIPFDSYNNIADSQIVLYPATSDGNKAVRLLITVEKAKCVPKNCSTSDGKKYYYLSNQSGTLPENYTYFSNDSCTTVIPDVIAHCGQNPFNSGSQGAVTIPNRLWIKYEIKLEGNFAAGHKIAIAARKHGHSGALLSCVGTLGYQNFTTTSGAQFVECRQGASTRTLIIKLVGQEEIKSWLAGSELLWGSTIDDTSPEAKNSTGIHVVTGRAADGPISIVGNIQRTGETEQFIAIPVTIRR